MINIIVIEENGIDRDVFFCYYFNIVYFSFVDILFGWYIFSCVLNVIFLVIVMVVNFLVFVVI